MQPFIRKALGGFLRFVVGIIIVAYLFSKIDLGEFLQIAKLAMSSKRVVLEATSLCFLSLFLGIVRWKIILENEGIKSSFFDVFSIFFIGHFFNSFLFGAAGGDIARAYYLAKFTHHKKAEAVATVLIDRMFGFVALCVMGVIMIGVDYSFFFSTYELTLAAIIMLIMFTGILVFFYLIFNPHLLAGQLALKIEKLFPRLTLVLKKMIVIMHLYKRRIRTLLMIVILSIAGHLILICYSWMIGLTMGIKLSFINYLTIIPTILTIAALPITPGGLGVREGLSVIFLRSFGATTEQAILLPLFLYALTLFWSLFGGGIFIIYGKAPVKKD